MRVNLLQGTCTPTLTPMPGVHNPAPRDAAPLTVSGESEQFRFGATPLSGSALAVKFESAVDSDKEKEEGKVWGITLVNTRLS